MGATREDSPYNLGTVPERSYDSMEALRDHPGVRRFIEWVKDKPHGRA